MNVGGYQIIDFNGYDFTSANHSVVIDGIYEKIEGTMKPILLTGVVLDGVEQRNAFVNLEVYEGTYRIMSSYYSGGYIVNITISDNDVVTCTFE